VHRVIVRERRSRTVFEDLDHELTLLRVEDVRTWAGRRCLGCRRRGDGRRSRVGT
jgi:hypothetical protein